MNIRRAVTNMIWPAILACLLMSAAVPPGVYRVALVSGGPCGTTEALADELVCPVP